MALAHSRPGCAMSAKTDCKKRTCKPAEICKLGKQIYRDWNGGGHHHEADE